MRLKKLREQQGASQAVLAKKVGISREHLSRLEGGRHDPTLTLLQKLAKALGVSVAELLE